VHFRAHAFATGLKGGISNRLYLCGFKSDLKRAAGWDRTSDHRFRTVDLAELGSWRAREKVSTNKFFFGSPWWGRLKIYRPRGLYPQSESKPAEKLQHRVSFHNNFGRRKPGKKRRLWFDSGI
jgi:hypothetical protein